MQPPCGKCKNQGCGAYHDICPEYQKFVEEGQKTRDAKKRERETIRITISEKTFRSRASKINSPFYRRMK